MMRDIAPRKDIVELLVFGGLEIQALTAGWNHVGTVEFEGFPKRIDCILPRYRKIDLNLNWEQLSRTYETKFTFTQYSVMIHGNQFVYHILFYVALVEEGSVFWFFKLKEKRSKWDWYKVQQYNKSYGQFPNIPPNGAQIQHFNSRNITNIP